MPTTKDLIEIAALEDEFDLFDGELIKAGDDVLEEIRLEMRIAHLSSLNLLTESVRLVRLSTRHVFW